MNSLMLLTIISSWIFKYIAYHPEMIIATTVNLIYIWQVDVNTPRWVYSVWIEGCLFVPILGNWIIDTVS